MDSSSLKLLAAGLCMGAAAIAAAIGQGQVFSSWFNAVARNPSADGKFKQVGFIGFAAVELVLLLGFVVAVMLMKA
jgi:F-type H+-transporting ATPase subunit c